MARGDCLCTLVGHPNQVGEMRAEDSRTVRQHRTESGIKNIRREGVNISTPPGHNKVRLHAMRIGFTVNSAFTCRIESRIPDDRNYTIRTSILSLCRSWHQFHTVVQ